MKTEKGLNCSVAGGETVFWTLEGLRPRIAARYLKMTASLRNKMVTPHHPRTGLCQDQFVSCAPYFSKHSSILIWFSSKRGST
jgi:hypothetical protein